MFQMKKIGYSDFKYISRIFKCLVVLINIIHISDFEASFIRLLDKLTNGSNIVVNETGM